MYQLRASVYDVIELLKDNERTLLDIENRKRKNKPVPNDYEVTFGFVIEALWRFLVPKRVLFLKFRPFLTRKRLARALTLDELKEADRVIARITGLSEGEPKAHTR